MVIISHYLKFLSTRSKNKAVRKVSYISIAVIEPETGWVYWFIETHKQRTATN